MSFLLLTVHLLQPSPSNSPPKTFRSRSRSLKMRVATLLNFSLLSFASAQTSSWGEPFTVDNDASTQNLLATSADLAPAPTITDEFSVSMPTELMSSSFSVSLPSPSGSGTTVSTPLTSSPSSSRTTQSGASTSGSGAQVQSTAAAAPAGVGAFQKKLGVAGVLAGAAGVLFV